MFITLQFPLFDYRFFEVDPNRTQSPKWPEPGDKARVRYFGTIIGRNTPYIGPWDDEKKYCNASSVFNFCGVGEQHFYKFLHSGPCNTRIMFRRFQSDGRCMAKFELGFNDTLEDVISNEESAAGTLSKSFFKYLEQYLLCPVKIKIGNRLSDYLPLIDAGDALRDAYYWTTTRGQKSFMSKDVDRHVDSCEPILLIQLDADKFDPGKLLAKKIDMPFLNQEGIQLFCRHVPYNIGSRKYNLKAWFIVTPAKVVAHPQSSQQFRQYDQSVRYLRINLLRIHVETCIQKKIIEAFGNTAEEIQVEDAAVRDRLYFYLHKILLNLTNIQRNAQPQQVLVEMAFRLDEFYYGSMRIEDQINVLEEYKSWLKNLQPTRQNQQVLQYLAQQTQDLENKHRNERDQRIVFISYNHADNKAAEWLRANLELAGITVILDSASMQAGTAIKEFITKSIRKSDAVLSVVSKNSLASGWVGVETINAISFKDYFPDKKFIPCNLDEDFLKDSYVDNAIPILEKRIAAIKDLTKARSAKEIRATDLYDEWRRLEALRLYLPEMIDRLKNDLRIDITGENLQVNFPKIVEQVKN